MELTSIVGIGSDPNSTGTTIYRHLPPLGLHPFVVELFGQPVGHKFVHLSEIDVQKFAWIQVNSWLVFSFIIFLFVLQFLEAFLNMAHNIRIGPNEAVAMKKSVDAEVKRNPTGKFLNFEILFISYYFS